MALFTYKARNRENKIVEGLVEAESESLAADILKDRGLDILSLEKKREVAKILRYLKFLRGVPQKDLIVFARQLSVMVSANVPIVRSLRILIKQISNPVLKVIVSELADEVEGGAKLSTALARHPEVFDDFFVNIIRSGETSGKLDEVLEYLATQKEKDYDLISKIRGAMIYPVFIISGLIIVGIVMMIFVIPRLTGILTESGAQLPLTTRILIGTSNFLSNYWWLLLIIIVGLIVGLRFYIRTPSGAYYWGYFKIKIPIFGPLFRRIYLVRFTRSLSTLLKGGVDLLTSLRIVSDVVGNKVYKDLIDQTIKEVEDGNPVSTVFMKSEEVPIMVSQMMSIGEQTGKMEEVLDRISDFYSRELTNMVNNLVTALEPLIMLVMGIAVGLMVVAVIVPMFNLANSM